MLDTVKLWQSEKDERVDFEKIACNGSNGRGDRDIGVYWLAETLANVRYNQIMSIREGLEKAKRVDIEKIESKCYVKRMLVV